MKVEAKKTNTKKKQKKEARTKCFDVFLSNKRGMCKYKNDIELPYSRNTHAYNMSKNTMAIVIVYVKITKNQKHSIRCFM